MAETLKERLARQEPLLPLIEEAIERWRRGDAEAVRDPKTGEALVVEDDPELGQLHVRCGERIVYRSRREKGG